MPTPFVNELRSYLATPRAHRALGQAQQQEPLLRGIAAPNDLVSLLRDLRTPEALRDAVLRGVMASGDRQTAVAVLVLAFRRSLRLAMRAVESSRGDADSELALLVCECLSGLDDQPLAYAPLHDELTSKLSECRRRARSERRADADLDELPVDTTSETDRVDQGRARRLAEQLPAVDRRIVFGHLLLGESLAELASELGLTTAAARQRQGRALNTLAYQMSAAAAFMSRARQQLSQVPRWSRTPPSPFGDRRTGPERMRSRWTSGTRPMISPASTKAVAVPG